jgi:hypothetical protein
MGFLLGAFGKLAAGRRVRDLQARLMRVQTKMRRATRSIEHTSKSLEAQKKAELNAANAMHMMLRNGVQPGILKEHPEFRGIFDVKPDEQDGSLKMDSGMQALMAQYQTASAMANSNVDTYASFYKQQIEERYEALNDLMLEPLKMEEDSLQTEKDSLESQLQIAQQDYEACKKMEQADAKNLAPNYTGQG